MSPSDEPAPNVVALVPAHQEEESIARTVKSLLDLPSIDEVVVLADGCRDRTALEAAGAGARVLVGRRRRGKGAAVESALARVGSARIVVLVDGDVGDTAGEVATLVEAVSAGTADVAVGVLPPLEGGGLGLVKWMAASLIRSLTGFDPAAPLSGQRALTWGALLACRPLAAGFGLETAMTIDAARLGLRIIELPVRMRHRPTGRSFAGFAHRARQGLDILRAAVPRFLGLR